MARKLLLVLDLDGTLLDREMVAAHQQFDTRLPKGNHHNKWQGWARPDLGSFKNYAFANFTVALWTSAMPETADEIAKWLFSDAERDRLLFIWSRAECSTVNGNVRAKDLRKIWRDFKPYGPENTILLDDTRDKAFYTPANLLLIPTFQPRVFNEELIEDQGLLRAQSFLEIMMALGVEDVQTYLHDHSFPTNLEAHAWFRRSPSLPPQLQPFRKRQNQQSSAPGQPPPYSLNHQTGSSGPSRTTPSATDNVFETGGAQNASVKRPRDLISEQEAWSGILTCNFMQYAESECVTYPLGEAPKVTFEGKIKIDGLGRFSEPGVEDFMRGILMGFPKYALMVERGSGLWEGLWTDSCYKHSLWGWVGKFQKIYVLQRCWVRGAELGPFDNFDFIAVLRDLKVPTPAHYPLRHYHLSLDINIIPRPSTSAKRKWKKPTPTNTPNTTPTRNPNTADADKSPSTKSPLAKRQRDVAEEEDGKGKENAPISDSSPALQNETPAASASATQSSDPTPDLTTLKITFKNPTDFVSSQSLLSPLCNFQNVTSLSFHPAGQKKIVLLQFDDMETALAASDSVEQEVKKEEQSNRSILFPRVVDPFGFS
ncbi:hypothetical protein HDV00_009697 [Rhizophlyctis rosea]|nr:hypothetical protein HDV00_009697 [Rhizophlyctis rosea]